MALTILMILNTILPVFVVAGVGFAFSRWVLDRDRAPGLAENTENRSDGVKRALHVLTFSYAGPAFVFTALRESSVDFASLGSPALMALIMYVLLTLIALGLGAAFRWEWKTRKGAVLALASKNCGNYGLPILLFAFGDEGLVIGTVFMITHILIHMTLGLSIASWSGDHPLCRRVMNILRFPYIYAIGLALIVRAIGIELPPMIVRSIALVGELWIPLMLILLGVELSGIRVGHVLKEAGVLTVSKLLIPPLLAWGVTWLLGVGGMMQSVLILQASTPTAVNGLLVARQFDTRPDLVASTLLLSTLGSILTIALLLGLFGA